MKYILLLLPIFLVSCISKKQVQLHKKNNSFFIEKRENPLVVAHRGGLGLFPENTMLAFQHSSDLGVDMFELDINLTKDGVLVVHHDLTIDRTSDGKGKLIDYTFEELQQFNFGKKFENENGNFPYKNIKVEISTFESVFNAFPNIRMIVELKNMDEDGKRAADELWRIIENGNFKDKILVASFNDDILDYFKMISNDSVFIIGAVVQTRNFILSNLLRMKGIYVQNAEALSLPMKSLGFNLVKKRYIKSAHRREMVVFYWTINNKADMKLLIESGVDGVITDRPDLMQEVLLGY